MISKKTLVKMLGDSKKYYVIKNDRDDEKYLKVFDDTEEARHWVINTLDLSKEWHVLNMEQAFNSKK